MGADGRDSFVREKVGLPVKKGFRLAKMRLRSLLNMRDRMKVYLQRYILMVVHLHLFLFLSLAISINRQLYGWKGLKMLRC